MRSGYGLLIRPRVELDSFVVMPNHLHGIVLLPGSDTPQSRTGSRLGRASRASGSLGSVVAGFKQAATLRLRRQEAPMGQRLWQRNYYEHVVRTEAELSQIRCYIEENPHRWAQKAEAILELRQGAPRCAPTKPYTGGPIP